MGSAVEFQLDGGSWFADASAPYSLSFGVLTPGPHTMGFRARDNHGVYSPTFVTAFTVAPRDENITLTLRQKNTLKGELSLDWSAVSGSQYYQLQRNILPLSSLYQNDQITTVADKIQSESAALNSTNSDAWHDVVHANTLSFNEYGVGKGIYYYRVRACFSANDCSGWADPVRAVIEKVEGLATEIQISNAVVPGNMPYSASVGGNGDAQVTIPVSVPPGINGVQPDLTLQYSSGRISQLKDNMFRTGFEDVHSGDYIGLGWRFTGLSQIQLCQTPDNASQFDIYFSGNYWCLERTWHQQPAKIRQQSHWQFGREYSL